MMLDVVFIVLFLLLLLLLLLLHCDYLLYLNHFKPIVIANFFKSSKPPFYLTQYHRHIILRTLSYITQKLLA